MRFPLGTKLAYPRADQNGVVLRAQQMSASARGLAGTHMWFCEEVGELTRALRRGQTEELEGEFADVLAWLSTLASIAGIDLAEAARKKYAAGCPRCASTPQPDWTAMYWTPSIS